MNKNNKNNNYKELNCKVERNLEKKKKVKTEKLIEMERTDYLNPNAFRNLAFYKAYRDRVEWWYVLKQYDKKLYDYYEMIEILTVVEKKDLIQVKDKLTYPLKYKGRKDYNKGYWFSIIDYEEMERNNPQQYKKLNQQHLNKNNNNKRKPIKLTVNRKLVNMFIKKRKRFKK